MFRVFKQYFNKMKAEWENMEHPVTFPLHVNKGDKIQIGSVIYKLSEQKAFADAEELLNYFRGK